MFYSHANVTLGSFVQIIKKTLSNSSFLCLSFGNYIQSTSEFAEPLIMRYLNKTNIHIKSGDQKKIYYCELYSIVCCEIMFLNDNQYSYVSLYWKKKQWEIYVLQIKTQRYFQLFLVFCHFPCILLT